MKEPIQSISATTRPEEERFDDAAGTLGAVLYADKTKSRVSEREWTALMDGVAAGNQLALRALYERTYRLVFTLIMRITTDPQTAEELTVDVFHDVWRRASTYDPAGGSVLGWIMNQARSRAIDRVRYEHRKKRINPHANGAEESDVEGDSSEAAEFKEKEQALRKALTLLNADERQAIEAAYFSELTYAEAAARLNQPLGTIKTRIRSGLSKLRRALAEAEAVT
jgi:RNA polymerase sigma-70 factor (ECF subfamily)